MTSFRPRAGSFAEAHPAPRQQRHLQHALSHDAYAMHYPSPPHQVATRSSGQVQNIPRRIMNPSNSVTPKLVTYVNLDPLALHPPDDHSGPFRPSLRQRRNRRVEHSPNDPPPLPPRQLPPLHAKSGSDTYSFLLQRQFRGLRKTLKAEAEREQSRRERRSPEDRGLTDVEAEEQQAIVEGLMRNSFHSLAPPPRIVSGKEELRLRSSRGGR